MACVNDKHCFGELDSIIAGVYQNYFLKDMFVRLLRTLYITYIAL